MARSRNLKPGFFKNEDLADCDPLARILFAGLWTIADREGRLEDRPKRVRAELLPYDNCDVDALLWQLMEHGFIERYSVDGQQFIQVQAWHKHQQPHIKEAESTIPAPVKHGASTVQAPGNSETGTGLISPHPSSLNLDTSSLNQRGGEKEASATDAPAPAEAKVTKLAAVPKPAGEPGKTSTGKTAAPRALPITPRMEVWAAEKVPRLVDLEDATEEWLDYCRRENVRFSDWEAAWRQAMRRAQEFADKKGRGTDGQRQQGNKPKRAIDESVEYFSGIYAEPDEAAERGNRVGLHGPAHGPAQRPGA